MDEALGGILGAAIGELGSRERELINNVVGFQTSKYFNKKARSDWRKSLLRGPSYMMEGLRRAGLNPILAVSGGGTLGKVSPFQVQGAAQMRQGAAGGNFQEAMRFKQEMATLKSNEEANMASARERNAMATLHGIQGERTEQQIQMDSANAEGARVMRDQMNDPAYKKAMIDTMVGELMGRRGDSISLRNVVLELLYRSVTGDFDQEAHSAEDIKKMQEVADSVKKKVKGHAAQYGKELRKR